jgi:hypothetical protein
MRSKIHNPFALAVLLVLFIAFLPSCDSISSPPQPANAAPASSTPSIRELTKEQIEKCMFEGNNETLTPSPIFRTSGDVRPFWVVAGKIQNECDYDLKAVNIRITVYKKGDVADVLDTADLAVEDVPAHSVRAYQRNVQLMVEKQQPFDFFYEYIGGTAAPSPPSNH